MNQPLCGPDAEASGETTSRGAARPRQDKFPALHADTSALFPHKEPVGPDAAPNNRALCRGPAHCGMSDNRDKRRITMKIGSFSRSSPSDRLLYTWSRGFTAYYELSDSRALAVSKTAHVKH